MACEHASQIKRKPRWLSRRLPSAPEYEQVRTIISQGRLHTVCEEAKCPNRFECFSQRTATFLIMGSRCTRDCRFCNVAYGPQTAPDPEEPRRVAEAAMRMGLQYVVVTSVTRDDLPDGGAGIFAETIAQIRRRLPDTRIEILIPDFQGDRDALKTVLDAEPHVLNHNIETVPRLYERVRPQAVYERSLRLLERASSMAPSILTKSGIMLGLGESDAEVRETLADLRRVDCKFLTIGQYLQPSRRHLAVERFVRPEEFDAWREAALAMGFIDAASGPFVRSSYHAKDLYQASGA
ncbi:MULTISPECIES: lipoyl synthase [Desulfococcus]|jgi:lipoic acid synthetase|uniref:Lipoyl synthase n=1 Tax=Desulfococcus multivorans DSM 2059 TaxID=1121405 RepID=S7TTM8_DESML|nr:lipoyl synthase [Desulfococcus multivorans]AOY57610.1 LipA: lipoyl synthase (lipoate synthase) [Desulfococcus multivorans]AQV00018.1 lipoyl synthase [Desulfococcus multivorans]EPR40396.1 Lipoyl synthase [Desulfococcus multivorans DSM 2059]MDX9819603.1 lipoyl synthase [Desulfococcus multivorans]SJZ76903.1 lipoic acid synthetase [Desulfococcus multivorans DSM 2059]